MRLSLARTALALVVCATISSSCTETPISPIKPTPTPVVQKDAYAIDARISEIHYDNTGTDANEHVRVSFPVGTNITGWRVIPYNGNGGATYTPIVTLTSLTATT